MKKRLTSLLLVFAMMFSMLGTAAPAFAVAPGAGSSVTITAEPKETQEPYFPGDTINFTVTLGPTVDLVGLRFQLDIPKGLTYVPNSGKAVPGLRDTMNAVKAEFVEVSKVFAYYGNDNYKNEKSIQLMTFQCTVDPDCVGQRTVGYVEKYNQAFNLDNEDIPCPFNECSVNVMVKHSVNALQNTHGTVSASPAETYAGNKVTLSAVPDEGYHFDSWVAVEPENLVIKGNKFTMPDQDVTVNAVILPDLYTVTVDGVPHKNVPHDSKLGDILPEKNPTQEGHTFVGWTANGETVTADTIVKGPMDVKSVFSTNEYQVSIFDGTNTTTHSVRYDSKLGDILPKENPTKVGWTFDYWSADGRRVDADTLVKGPMSVEAIFSKNRFLIVVDGVEHPGVEYGTPLSEVLPQEDPVKEGYTFVGWFVGEEPITREAAITGPMNIHSKFEANKDTAYTVNHLLEDLDGRGYTLAEAQPMTGTTDTQTTAVAKHFEGFTAPETINQVNIAPDGSAVVEIRYTRNSYKVTFQNEDDPAVEIDVKYDDTLEGKLPENPVKPGYTFQGWFDGDTKITAQTHVKGVINARSSFTANPDTKYVVNHMWENIEDDGYTLHESVSAKGTTDTLTAAQAKEYEGFTAQEFAQKNINGDGTTVVEIRYTREIHSVTVDDLTYQVKYGDTLTRCLAQVPSKMGYTFVGWFSGNQEVTKKDIVTGDMTIKSVFAANTDTKYVVNHLLENLDGRGYTLTEAQPMTGTTDTLTAAQAKEYPGFTAQEFAQKNINGDGKTEVEIRYTRNTYPVTVDGLTTNHVKYGSTLKDLLPENPTKQGWTFDGWKCSGETVTADTKVEGAMNIESQWIANTDTKYVVKYLLENVDNNQYTPAEDMTQNLTGTTGQTTTVEPQEIEGFTAQPVAQQVIKGDGTTVVLVRYSRNTYTVTVGNKTIENVKYGTSMKGRMPEDAVKPGYTFDGWFDGDTEITADTVVKGNINAEARFIANENTKYVVKHMLENIEDDGFTLDDTVRLNGKTGTLTAAQAKEYEGFTVQEFTQQPIEGDGSTVIEIHYIRNTYTVTVDGTAHEGVKHGAKLSSVLPSNPVHGEDIFSGWYVGDMGVTGEYVVKSDLNVESKWNLDTYTVTFHAEGSEDVVRSSVKHGTLLTELLPEQEPALKGHTFKGWYNGEKEITASDRVTANLNITAKFEANIYEVTFRNESDRDVVIHVKYGQTIGEQLPEAPEKVGYTFQGWFDGDTEVDADTKIQDNLTAIAQFKANTATPYIVKHLLENVNDDKYTVSEADTQNLTGTTDTMTAAQAKNFTGFTAEEFAQKNINGDGSTVIEIRYKRNTFTVTVGDKTIENVKYGTSLKGRMPADPAQEGHTFQGWFDGSNRITENTVVIADINAAPKFEPITYHVTFKAEGQEDESIPVKYGEAIGQNLPQAPAKAGYTFLGWFNGDEKLTEKTVVKGDIQAEAKYEINAYDVVFQVEGQEYSTISVNYNEKIGSKMPKAPEKTGYTFVGWFSGEQEITKDTEVKSGMTVTAQFKVNTYDVTFKAEGQDDVVVSVTYGSNIGLKLPKEPVKDGYTFLGWFDGDTQITADTVVEGSMTATAKYRVNAYDVTFKAEGQDDVVVSVKYGETIGSKLPQAPAKTGYTFVGWFDGETQITDKTVVENAITATAKYQVNPYDVTFKAEGQKDVVLSVNYGETIGELPEEPVKEGHTFLGWFDGDTQITEDTVVKGAMTVTAKFQINNYTVTVDGVEHKDVPYGTTLKDILPEPENKPGYTFNGWFAGETEVNAKTTVKGDMTITGSWEFIGFVDVPADIWYYDGVRYTTSKGLMSGISGTHFGPDIAMNRAMVVQVLYSMAGKPDVAPTNEFKDVPADIWYAKAVAWAVKVGVASGYGNGYFGSKDEITREQMAVMLYSYVGKPAVSGKLNFADVNDVSEWAKTALLWAVNNGILSGVPGNRVAPQDSATRAMAAVMMTKFDKQFGK